MATQYVEKFTGRALINRTITLFIDGIDEVDVALYEGTRVLDLSIRKRYIELPTTQSQAFLPYRLAMSDTETTYASTKILC